MPLEQQVFALFDVLNLRALDRDRWQLVETLHEVGDVRMPGVVLLQHRGLGWLLGLTDEVPATLGKRR